MMRRAGSSAIVAGVAHLVAVILAASAAWMVAHTQYYVTGLQFVAPLAVLLAVHVGSLVVTRGPEPGFAMTALARMTASAFVLVVVAVATSALAPMPARAAVDMTGVAGTILPLVLCLAIVAVVMSAAALVIYVVVRIAAALLRMWDGRVGDYSVLALAGFAILALSLEGVVGGSWSPTADRAAVTLDVHEPPDRVWREVGHATSAAFPLPVLFLALPRPIAVSVDEGADLGARRVVHFTGREGSGDLTLQVTRRTPEEARFDVVSDTSPIAHWVRHRSLSYKVEPGPGGARLTVSLDYERRLAPSWFFRPFVRLAATLAVDVLARDTRARAEAG